MEQRYLDTIRRWLWLLILTTLVAGMATFWFVKDQSLLYESKVRLIIGPGIDTPDPDMNALRAGGQLMQTYAELSMTGPFLQSIIDEFNLGVSPLLLRESIEVTTNQETQILSIAVRRQDPAQSIAIANFAADKLVELSPSSPDSSSSLLKDQMRFQAKRIEQVIAESETNIKQLEGDLQAITSADTQNQSVVILQTDDYLEKQRLIIEQLSQERTRLADSLSALTVLYDTLQQTTTNQVKIVEPAVMAVPVPAYMGLKVIVGAIAGLVIALALVFASEFFDDAIWMPDELDRKIDLPVLGAIPKHQKLDSTGHDALVLAKLPGTLAAESYRLLATKLLYAGEGELQNTILLSSLAAKSGDDSGLVASNIALALAQADKDVIIVDADLHRPTITETFGLIGQPGLTDFLQGDLERPNLVPVEWEPKIKILPGGESLSQPFKLISSARMLNLITQLESSADMVLIITSPLASSADSMVLASKVDNLILVARSGQAHRRIIDEVNQSLSSFGAKPMGVVFDFNRPNLFLDWLSVLKKGIVAFPKFAQNGIQSIVRGGSLGEKDLPTLSSNPKSSLIADDSVSGNQTIMKERSQDRQADKELVPNQPVKS